MKYGKRANHVRYIKQVTDDKGRLTKKSKRVSYWATFNFVRLAYLVGIVIGFLLLIMWR